MLRPKLFGGNRDNGVAGDDKEVVAPSRTDSEVTCNGYLDAIEKKLTSLDQELYLCGLQED